MFLSFGVVVDSSFAFETDAAGSQFVTMTHDETTKNHPGGISEVESFEKNGRMYKTNSQVDVYSALEFFLTKLNPECDALQTIETVVV